jgi:hypothetical protein
MWNHGQSGDGLFVLSRRRLLSGTALSATAASGSAAIRGAVQDPHETRDDLLGLAALPNYCAHEHWGSFNAIGAVEDGFRADVEAGAVPKRTVSIFDLILDPYFGGWLNAGGMNLSAECKAAGVSDPLAWCLRDPASGLAALRPHLVQHRSTGVFLCLQRGIYQLHGVDIGSLDWKVWELGDASIGKQYADIFSWYPKAMERAHFSALIRPVHPEFHTHRQDSEALRRERPFTRTVLRIDPLLKLWRISSLRRDRLAGGPKGGTRRCSVLARFSGRPIHCLRRHGLCGHQAGTGVWARFEFCAARGCPSRLPGRFIEGAAARFPGLGGAGVLPASP